MYHRSPLPTSYSRMTNEDNNNNTRFLFQNSLPNNLDSLIPILTTNPPYKLTLSIEELIAPGKKRKNPKLSPPRPQNVFILFKKDLMAKWKLNNFSDSDKKLQLSDYSKKAKATWESQSNEVKQYFQILYIACVEKHKEIFPNYKYLPRPTRKKGRPSKHTQQVESNIYSTSSTVPPIGDQYNLNKPPLMYQDCSNKSSDCFIQSLPQESSSQLYEFNDINLKKVEGTSTSEFFDFPLWDCHDEVMSEYFDFTLWDQQ